MRSDGFCCEECANDSLKPALDKDGKQMSVIFWADDFTHEIKKLCHHPLCRKLSLDLGEGNYRSCDVRKKSRYCSDECEADHLLYNLAKKSNLYHI